MDEFLYLSGCHSCGAGAAYSLSGIKYSIPYGIIPASLNRSNALNHDSIGAISSPNPTSLALSKLICRSKVK